MACLVLTRFIPHLEGSKFSEKDEVMYLLECVKNSLKKPNGKITSIITIFLVKSLKLFLKPDEHMYPIVSNYLLLRPGMDPLDLPEFFVLFNSHAMQYKEDRSWILNHLADGLRETADYSIFERKYAFKFLQTFYSSSISDNKTQMEVLTIIGRAVKLQNVTLNLVRHHGLVTWLDGVITSCGKGHEKISLIVSIINDLWYTMLGDRDTQPNKQTHPDLPVHFTNDMLHTAWSLLNLLAGSQVQVYQIKTFLEMLQSMLEYLERSRSLYPKQLGHKAWNRLATSHVLQVLALWQKVTKDDHLQQQLTTIDNMYGSVTMETKGATQDWTSKKKNRDVKSHTNSALSKSKLESMLTVEPDSHLCSVVLEIICHWTVKDTDAGSLPSGRDSQSKIVSVSFFVLQWVLEQYLKLRKDGIATHLCSSITKWIEQILNTNICGKSWVQYIATAPELTQMLIDLLLVMYTKSTECQEGQDSSFVGNLNKILLMLLDAGRTLLKTCKSVDGSNPLLLASKLSTSTAYCQVFDMLKEIDGQNNDRSLATILLELFSGSNKPNKSASILMQN